LVIARTVSPTPSLFVAQRLSACCQGNVEKFWGRLRGGVGKSGVLEHKSGNISLKPVKIGEKLLCRAYRKSPTLYRMVLMVPFHADPLHLLSLDWRFATHTSPKTPIAIISGMDKATDFKFGQYIYRVHSNKSPLIF